MKNTNSFKLTMFSQFANQFFNGSINWCSQDCRKDFIIVTENKK